MKRLTIFILILLSSFRPLLKACTDYYAYGENIRYSIFDPQVFHFKDYGPFFYSAHYFADFTEETEGKTGIASSTTGEQMNIELWRKRCKNIPSENSIYDAIYGQGNEFLNSGTANLFVKYLKQKNYTDAIVYLAFAKNASFLADFLTDPWERNEHACRPLRDRNIEGAVVRAKLCKDEAIKRRYAFQAIRTAFYNDEPLKIESIYREFFINTTEKNIIDYWAMYFYVITQPTSSHRNFLAAQVFANAPDKRYGVSDYYDRKIAPEKVLQEARNKDEEAAVWLMAGIRNPGRAYESLTNLFALHTEYEGLNFLLLREINKLEDWIYTPYYSAFEPSVLSYDNAEFYNDETSRKKRIKNDRLYARKILDFVNRTGKASVGNNVLWESARAYLLFMTENDSTSLTQISNLQGHFSSNKKLNDQLDMIKALCLINIQPKGSAVIPDQIMTQLLRKSEVKDHKFIFAVSRELEYKGNTADAAALLSLVNPFEYDYEHLISWKGKKGRKYWYSDVYSDYFSYVDAVYTPAQIENLIFEVEKNANDTNKFIRWKFGVLKKDKARLFDLLGTKYMRENNLSAALISFQKVDDTLWTSDFMPFKTYIDANPFFTNFYNEHTHTIADSIRFNKLSITSNLINYLSKADDVSNKDRDYYYFLAANCYFNMTHYGNSWMMKSYSWESTMSRADFAGGHDYFCCDLAKSYYLKAKTVSKRKEFAALCLRMAGRCEKYRLNYNSQKDSYYLSGYAEGNKIFATNKYYTELRKMYPYYYEDLISNCNSFEEYFRKRR